MTPVVGVLPAEWDIDEINQNRDAADLTDDPDELRNIVRHIADVAVGMAEVLAGIEADNAADGVGELDAVATELERLRAACHADNDQGILDAAAAISARDDVDPGWERWLLAAGCSVHLSATAREAPPTAALCDVPPIGDILTITLDADATTATPVTPGDLYVPGGVYHLRAIGNAAVVKTIYTIADDTEDDLLDVAKDAADIAGWTVTDYRTEPDQWVLEGARHLNTGS